MRLLTPFVYAVCGIVSVMLSSAVSVFAGLLAWRYMPTAAEIVDVPLAADLRTIVSAAVAVVAGVATHRTMVRAVRDDVVAPVKQKQPDVIVYHSAPAGYSAAYGGTSPAR